MKKFEHFLLTKFNKSLYTRSRKKGGDFKTRDEWMKHRIRLFEKYCLPSIKNQVNQNFKWLVLFDSNTPKKYFKKIQEYMKYKNFIPIYDKWFDIYIKKHLKPETQYLITTRIDNDDAFHKRAIKRLQEQLAEQKLLFLNFPIGYCLEDKTGKITLNGSKSNPFITLIEKVRRDSNGINVKTVRCMNHSHLGRLGEIKQICVNTPMWVQVIHDRNIVNQLRGKPVPLKQFNRNDFGL